MTIPGINLEALPSGVGCLECEAAGGWWVHLRRCAQCGHVGCCDSSPEQHASHHAENSGHPIVQSFEPDEEWYWDYTAQAYAEGPHLPDPQHHPLEQTVPGPADRVPTDWMTKVH